MDESAAELRPAPLPRPKRGVSVLAALTAALVVPASALADGTPMPSGAPSAAMPGSPTPGGPMTVPMPPSMPSPSSPSPAPQGPPAPVLDGKIDPAGEYVFVLPPLRRTVDKTGLDAVLAVGRSREAYHLCLRFPTDLTAEDIENAGAFPVTLFTAGGPAAPAKPGETDRDRSRPRVPLAHIPADAPLGKKLAAPNGTAAVRRLDAKLGVLVVELSIPLSLLAVDAGGDPLVRIEMENRNSAHRNGNVGRAAFPPAALGTAAGTDPDGGLGRLPADPSRAALSAALDEIDSQLALLDGDPEAVSALAARSAEARAEVRSADPYKAKVHLLGLADRLGTLVEQRRLGALDALALRVSAESALRLLAE
jgi:hypothetical protein